MRVQCSAPDLFTQQVSLFFQQRVSPQQPVAPFFRTRTTSTDKQTSLLAGSDRHVLGVRYEASPRARRHRNPHEEPLIGELLLGQGLCEGLDTSLHEVVVLGLLTCVGVGFVRRPHLLVGGVHSVTTNPRGSRVGSRSFGRLKENKEKRKLDGMESSKSKSDAHFMHG